MSVAVIDGDLIGFKASAACETRFVIATHKQSNRTKRFDNRTKFKDWLKSQDKWEESDFDITDDRDVEPIANCLHTVKSMINNIQEMSGCSEVKIVVQGEGNFRDNLLLPTKYKSSRQDQIRPAHLKEVQGYLINKYKAERANGKESDDFLSMYAWEGFKTKKKIVQCTVDKDANQCQGWLLNWDKMQEPEFISGLGDIHLDNKGKLRGKGRKWLYIQATVGDPSDCYKPTELTTFRYGEKAAFNDFNDLKSDKECWQKMNDLYSKWYPEPFTYTAWNGEEVNATYIDMMQLYVDAAHMLRWEGDRVIVRDVLEKMRII